jgi:F-type H+-transporting ATPase subunit b
MSQVVRGKATALPETGRDNRPAGEAERFHMLADLRRRRAGYRSRTGSAVQRVMDGSATACELLRKVAIAAALLLVAPVHPVYAAEGGSLDAVWAVANFAILVGILYYFGRKPVGEYLAGRQSQIRKDLVDAAALKATATADLEEIERRMQALPGELESLRRRGQEEIVAEERRIAAAADAERARLLEQARREIDLQVRLARRELVEHAAELSVKLATERIERDITPADQDRLVDTYLRQVK